jgi:nitrogen fixation/metabolism regulation signal transduction histidine kinase
MKRPIQRTLEFARKVAGGDLSLVLDLHQRDELATWPKICGPWSQPSS